MKTHTFFILASLIFCAGAARLHAQGGVAPKALVDFSAANADAQVSAGGGGQVSAVTGRKGIDVAIKPGDNGFPGITIKPAGGASWDLGIYGHVEVVVTNTGGKKIRLNVRVDNAGDYKTQPWNAESKEIGPGQKKTIRVYFGYSYGFRPGFKLNPAAIISLTLFTGKTKDDLAFRIDSVQGAGWTGEKIGPDPDLIGIKPPGGILLGPSLPAIRAADQIAAGEGAKASPGADGKSLMIDFTGGKEESVTFKPATGLWNLNEHLEVKVKVKNTGTVAVTPSARVESGEGPSDTIAAAAPLAPGEETEIVIPFAAKVPWKGVVDPKQSDPKVGGGWKNQPGTGTLYRSNKTTGVTILSDSTAGAKSLTVTFITAGLPALALPEWLGKRPPVEGEWTQTLAEEFDGNTIDLHRWNVHAPNYWDKRMHFSKDQVIVKDGHLALRLEKKTGYHNDDPTGKIKHSGAKTDYATGQVDTFGKWTQRFGYFEIREKQSGKKCLWPGFWMVPDRGLKAGKNRWGKGMEFDITESQSAWGIYRFNVACHWDGYKETHKSIGTSSNYVQADKDGFIVVGFLWTPGSIVAFGNGREIFRWESPRISDEPECLILQNEIGGWDNEPVDDAQLPADFVVDYIRVWQRKDLASPEDGAKPNKGEMDAFNETLPEATPSPSPAK